MDKDIITKISSIETKLENSLEAEDFISVSSLSVELDQLVKELTEAAKVEKFSDIESQELEQLLLKLDNFKKQTVERFKNYTSKVSQQTKMHRAYKQ